MRSFGNRLNCSDRRLPLVVLIGRQCLTMMQQGVTCVRSTWTEYRARFDGTVDGCASISFYMNDVNGGDDDALTGLRTATVADNG